MFIDNQPFIPLPQQWSAESLFCFIVIERSQPPTTMITFSSHNPVKVFNIAQVVFFLSSPPIFQHCVLQGI